MKTKLHVSLFIITMATLLSCTNTKKKNSASPAEINFTKEGELNIIKSTGDTIKTIAIEIADTDYERQTGLMYRKSMDSLQGMLFISETTKVQNFYMKNTLIPLDIIYIGEDQKIVSFQKNTKPLDESSLPSYKPAKYILEVNAGLSDQWDLEIGDRIAVHKN